MYVKHMRYVYPSKFFLIYIYTHKSFIVNHFNYKHLKSIELCIILSIICIWGMDNPSIQFGRSKLFLLQTIIKSKSKKQQSLFVFFTSSFGFFFSFPFSFLPPVSPWSAAAMAVLCLKINFINIPTLLLLILSWFSIFCKKRWTFCTFLILKFPD